MPEGRFHPVREFDELDSTNRYLLEEARRGGPEGMVAVADHQSAGRGRLGRTWEAPAGSSLLMSVLLRPPLEARQLYLATAAVALSTAAACRRAAGAEARCKWPNDLVVEDRKLAGVLAEVEMGESGAGPRGKDPAVVVGVGLNVSWPGPAGAGGTSLLEVTGREVDRQALRTLVLEELEVRRRALDDEVGRSGILAELRALSATLGRLVRVERAGAAVGGAVEGLAVDLNEAGHLVLETDTGRVELSVGDVVHLRPAGGLVP